LALLSRLEDDEARRDELLDEATAALERATEMDATYADPHCFLAIVEYQFRGDASAALPHVEVCESSNPPRDVAELVAGFAAEIRAAV
jgi:hypothetical protein